MIRDRTLDELSTMWRGVFVPDPDVPLESLWQPDHVKDAYVDAVRLVHSIAGPIGPRSYGRSWMDVADEAMAFGERVVAASGEDVKVQEWEERLIADRNRWIKVASSAEVTRMERALEWPRRYLANDPELRVWLILFARARVLRSPFNRICNRAGIARVTADRRVVRAASVIAMALNRERVPRDT